MTDHDYPTEDTLTRIREWPHTDFRGLLEFVRGEWTYPERFEGDGARYEVSTGGWSGNEDLIGAMQRNVLFWAMCWEASRRGGWFAFEIPEGTK